MKAYESYKNVDLPWLKRVPEHWEVKRIGSLFSQRIEKVSDKVYAPLSVTKYGIVPQLSDAAKTNNGDDRKLVCVGDFVINSRSDRKGSSGLSKLEGSVAKINLVLKPRTALTGKYIHYLLKSNSFIEEYYRNGRGIVADLWTTGFSDMKTIWLPVPPKEEQEQIVRYLDWQNSRLNKLILNINRRIVLLKECLLAALHNSISKNNIMLKLKRISKLECDFISPCLNASYQKIGMYNRGRGIFLRPTCLGRDLGDSKFQRIYRNRLLISGQFAWEDAVYVTQDKDQVGIASHRYYQLSPRGGIPTEYLWAYFISDQGSQKLVQCSHGAAGRNRPLNIKELLETEIPVSTDNSQVEYIVKIARKIISFQNLEKIAISLLQEYRTRLVADVVTGQIDVRNITIPNYETVTETIDQPETAEDEANTTEE